MKKIFLMLAVAVLFASCNSSGKEKPEVFLEQKEFISLLAEIHLSDAVAEEKGKGDPKIEQILASKGLEQILKNNNLSRPQFDSIFNYYVSDPNLLKEVYTKLIEDLSKKQAELVR